MGGQVEPPGSARLVLVDGVAHLDPARAVFDGMLDGWEAQQRARLLSEQTIGARRAVVRRFAGFTNEYPWAWRPADVEDFASLLRSGDRPRAHSTIRNYQIAIGLFCGFITDTRYGWAAACEKQFGSHPVQICHEWNTAAHVTDSEARPGRRSLTKDELQALFDHADAQVDRVARSGRKGAAAAFRDAVLVKVVYGWGLRRNEAVQLDVVDCRPNPTIPVFGTYGAVQVRYGKASRGSPPKRRTVLSVFDWAVEALTQYVEQVRPLFDPGQHPALWMTERASRLAKRALDERFAGYRDAVGLPPELTLHCLRHSYVTHLIEDGFPERFVQEQVGHAYAATTAIYTSVGDDYKNRILQRALARAFTSSGSREAP